MAAKGVLGLSGLSGPTEAQADGLGRWRLPSGKSIVRPLEKEVSTEEQELTKVTDISKMKGQHLLASRNAKLVVVNQRYMTYVMKEGAIRMINQNGKDVFKLSNSTKAPILDVAIMGNGTKDSGTSLVCADENARVSIFILDAKPGVTSEDRTKRVELVLATADAPHRLLAHPEDKQLFVTVHSSSLRLWSLSNIEKEQQVVSDTGFTSHAADGGLLARTSVLATLPDPGTSTTSSSSSAKILSKLQAGSSRIRDASFSADGSCLVALTADTLYVWQISLSTIFSGKLGSGLQLVQQLSLAPDFADIGGLHMIRFLGNYRNADYERTTSAQNGSEVEAMVLGSSTGCNLLVYRFSPKSKSPVGSIVQSLHFTAKGSEIPASLEVDCSRQDTLALGFHDHGVILVMPLVNGWGADSKLAFSYVQRLGAEMGASQLTIMSAKSCQRTGASLFLYRSMNFVRPKDGLPGCNVVVHEVNEPEIVSSGDHAPALDDVASEVAVSSDRDTTPRELPPGLAAPDSEALPAPKLPRANGFDPAAEETAAAGDVSCEDSGDAATGAAANPEASSRGRSQQWREDLDWGFVKQIAASFVRGLDKRRGELSEKVVSEVAELVMQSGPSSGSATSVDVAVLEAALVKIKEAREVQATGEKNLQAAVRKATDSWAETSAATVSGLLQKEFGKISDGVAATLAQQLSQSKKFCEALARGVQKSGGLATKQALESLRPPKQLQETVGNALGEALHESLAPVFRAELRQHFEQELAPLIGQRVGDMMSSFRGRMTECLEGIAAEQEAAAKRLGRDLGPVVAEELKQVERIIAQHRSSSSSGAGGSSSSGSLSEAQLDDLANAVQVEVVQPLHSRIKELTAQVQALRQETQELEKRWSATGAGSHGADLGSALSVDSQAAELERLFGEGKVEDAFVKAMRLQATSEQVDVIGRLCALVPSADVWLAGEDTGSCISPLSMPIKMLLMLSLAKQLAAKPLEPDVFLSKVDWIQELWLAFEVTDKDVRDNAGSLCSQLVEVLEQVVVEKGDGTEPALRKLKRSLQQATKMMTRNQ